MSCCHWECVNDLFSRCTREFCHLRTTILSFLLITFSPQSDLILSDNVVQDGNTLSLVLRGLVLICYCQTHL